jgi:hypothetical protein
MNQTAKQQTLDTADGIWTDGNLDRSNIIQIVKNKNGIHCKFSHRSD